MKVEQPLETGEKKWYVIRAISGYETKTKDRIKAEINRCGYAKQVEEILVPKEKVVRIKGGKRISKEKIYFPGYIMIKADLSGEIPHIIKSITNVMGFLSETKGGVPVALRTAEVNRMLGKVDEMVTSVEHVVIPFKIGESVKVIDGPFNGFNGNVEEVNEDKLKLKVMVKIFGRKTPLELNYLQVEKI